jgi:hypothetical protein
MILLFLLYPELEKVQKSRGNRLSAQPRSIPPLRPDAKELASALAESPRGSVLHQITLALHFWIMLRAARDRPIPLSRSESGKGF